MTMRTRGMRRYTEIFPIKMTHQIFPGNRKRAACAAAATILMMVALLLAAGCSTVPGTQNTSFTLLQDKYVFVEHHTSISGELLSGDSGACGPERNLDFPSYSFEKKNGVLSLYGPSETPVNESVKMFYGDGVSLSGVAGYGALTWASPVYLLPHADGNVTLESISGDGTVLLRYNQERILLNPKESRENTTRLTRSLDYNRSCIAEIITSESFYNAGILDKGTIVTR